MKDITAASFLQFHFYPISTTTVLNSPSPLGSGPGSHATEISLTLYLELCLTTDSVPAAKGSHREKDQLKTADIPLLSQPCSASQDAEPPLSMLALAHFEFSPLEKWSLSPPEGVLQVSHLVG